MSYKVEVNGETIEYGPYVENSRFTNAEWNAIYQEMVKKNQASFYEARKDDKEFITVLGALIDIEERYEALLELLPQSSFSKAGTHPQWVADAVEGNTLDKVITQSDVKDMVADIDDVEELKTSLIEYFGIEELE